MPRADLIQVRRGTEAQWLDAESGNGDLEVLAQGEPGLIIDVNGNAEALVFGDVGTDFGDLPRFEPGGGGPGGGANLGYTAAAAQGTVTSDSGTDATLPLGTGTNAGLLAPAQHTKLGHVTVTQAVDLDAIETAVAGAVLEADYNAHTVLAATTDNTPAPLTVAEQTLVGRITGGNIDDLSASQVRTLLALVIGTNVQAWDADLDALALAFARATGSGPATLAFAEDTDNGVHTVTITAPAALGGSVTLTLRDESGTIALVEDEVDVEDLAAADQTETAWQIPMAQDGVLVKGDTDMVTRPSRIFARGDRYVGYEDFGGIPIILNATTTSLVGSTEFLLWTSGTTAGCSWALSPNGVVTLTTGTTSSTGYASAAHGMFIEFAQAQDYKFAARATIPTPTATGQTFDTYIGWRNAWNTNAVNDGMYFHAKSGNSAGNWFAVNEDDTGISEEDTGIAVAAGFHVFYIHYDGAAGEARYYIDGVLESTRTASRPDENTTLSAGGGIFKTAGTTARTLNFDTAEWDLYVPARGDLMGQFSL